MEIKIDPEFRDIIPALTGAEYEQLEKNLLLDGCREKIIVWNDFLIDGHNRYSICTKHDLDFEILELNHFEDRHAVIDWMIQNQIGKRNLTGGTISYLRGLKLKREKLKRVEEIQATLPSAQDKSETPSELDADIDTDADETVDEVNEESTDSEEKSVEDKTDLQIIKEHEEEIAQDVADMYQISPSTLKKDERFTDAIDTIRTNLGREMQDKILNKELKINSGEVVSISKMETDEQKEFMSGDDEEIIERLAEVKREKQQLNLKKSLIKLDAKLNHLNTFPVEGIFDVHSEEEEVHLIYRHDDGVDHHIETFKGIPKLDTYLDGFIEATSLFTDARKSSLDEDSLDESDEETEIDE